VPADDSLWIYLREPVVWLLFALVGLLMYRLSGVRKRRLRKHRAALRLRAARAATPRERRELMLQWNELGGLKEHARRQRRVSAREEGQKARAAGRSRSANPYGHSLWGEGRLWKQGWKSVDHNIRWIRKRRQ